MEIKGVNQLSTRIITALILVVLLTAMAVGLPGIWILRSQLDQQAWAQVDQGQQAAAALYEAHHRELQNLAVLTAQRPTLQSLLKSDLSTLRDYLYDLRSGAGLTNIIVCDPSGGIVVATDPSIPDDICKTWKMASNPYESSQAAVCMTAHQAIENETGLLGEVFVCNHLDRAYVTRISAETSLEHTLWVEDRLVATSFSVDADLVSKAHNQASPVEGCASCYVFEVGGSRYYATRIPLDDAGLSAEVALDVSDIVISRNRLAFWMGVAILGVAFGVSLLGVLISQQISRPLVNLARSAEDLRRGSLDSPVQIDVRVLEVAQVAKALERARTDLLQTMTSLKVERDWSEHLLASIVEGIVTLDLEGAITFFSHGAERITGWSSAEVQGRKCDDVFRLARGSQLFSQVIPPAGKRAKADVLLSGKREASLAITRAELVPKAAADAEVVLVFRDISEEEAIHRILGHFLANVAHEFRTPLSALAASIELLLDQAPDLSPSELQELLISLHLGTLGLQTLIDNLLESASIEAGRFHISPRMTDLGRILAEAVDTVQPLLDKYGQRMVVELPVDFPKVWADPRRIVQVLVNLIGNANKYGPADSEIELKVTKDVTEIRVAVSDRGPGISPQARAELFHRFIYPDGETGISQAGAGLGLSVVKAIVEAHGGRVGVDDRQGGGSVFWFTLPTQEKER